MLTIAEILGGMMMVLVVGGEAIFIQKQPALVPFIIIPELFLINLIDDILLP